MKLYALLVICLCIQSCLAIGWHAVWEYEGPNCMGKAKATLTKTAKGYNTTRCTPFLNNNNAATPMYAMTGCVDKGFEMIESFSVSTSATCDSSVANYTSPFGSCVTTSADSSYASQCTMDGLYNAEFLQVMGFTKATMYYTDSACTLAKAMKVVIESTTNGTDTECTSANYLKLSACKAVDGVYQNQLCGPVTDVFFFTQRYYNKNSWDLRHNFVFDAKFTDGSCQNQALTGISAKVTKVNSWGQCMKNPDSDVYARTMCGPLDGFQTHSAIYTSPNSDCSAPVVHSNTTQSVCLRGSTGSSITSCSTMLHPVISQSFLKGVSLMAGLIVFTDNWNCDPKVAQLKSFDFVPVANCSDYELPAKVGPIIPEFDYCFRFDPEYRIYVCDTPQKIFTKRLGFNFDAEAALFTPSASATSSPAATSSASSSDSSSSSSASTSSASTSSSPSTPSPSSSPSTSSPSSSPSTSSPTSSPSTSSSPPPPPPVSETPTDAPSTSSSSLLVVSSLFLFSLFASLF